MSDLTDLLDNAADLLRTLQNLEQAHNLGDRMEVDTILYGLDPVEIRAAQRDLCELWVRWKALDELGGGTIRPHDGSEDTHRLRVAPSADPTPRQPSAPEHPGFSVKVNMELEEEDLLMWPQTSKAPCD